LSGLELTWPSANGKLMKVKFDGDVVWDSGAAWTAGGIVLTSANFTTDMKKKSIQPGQTRTFTLEFEKNAVTDLAQYDGLLTFGSGCTLDFPPAPSLVSSNFCTTVPGKGKPRTLTLIYTGQNCPSGCNSQADGKVVVSGNPNNADPVYIKVTDAKSASVVWFQSKVDLNDSFIIDAFAGAHSTVGTNTTVTIYASQSGPVLSTVTFHTSCSQPLIKGDFYGSLKLDGFTR
jgi:hypothetical protein